MPHQRRPVGFLGRRIGFGDETGATEIDGCLPGMSGVGPGFAVDVDVLLEHPHILVPHRQEQALAGVARRGEGFDAHRRDADFGRWLLHRLRHDRDVLDVVKLALVGEIVFPPGALNDFQTLDLAVLAFGIGDVQRLICLHDAAAPGLMRRAPRDAAAAIATGSLVSSNTMNADAPSPEPTAARS